jgi:hypothetical protein
VRDCPAGLDVGKALFDRLYHIEVVQDVVERGVVRQPLE